MHKHLQIEQYIKAQIESGVLLPGNQIETEEELASHFCVSRPTVRQAVTKLALNGYLKRIKGKGTFVTEPKLLHTSTNFLASYRMEAARLGYEITTKVTELLSIRADDEISNNLALKNKMQVTKLSRIRWADASSRAKPVVFTTVYVPHKLFPQMPYISFDNVSLYDTLEAHNLKVCHVSKELEVVMPTTQVRDALELDYWEPTIFISSKGYLENGSIIEYAQSWYPASSSKFLIELQKGGL